MDSICFNEEQLVELIAIHMPHLQKGKITLKERCLTDEGGIRLFYDVDFTQKELTTETQTTDKKS